MSVQVDESKDSLEAHCFQCGSTRRFQRSIPPEAVKVEDHHAWYRCDCGDYELVDRRTGRFLSFVI